MPWADLPVFNLTLLMTALAAVLLAGILLAIEFLASQFVSRRAPGAIVLLLLAVALGCCSLPATRVVALGSCVLAMLVLVAWTLSNDLVRRQIAHMCTPKLIWGSVLLIGMVASRFLAAHVLQSLDNKSIPQVLDLEDVPIRRTYAMTDDGQPVALFHFRMHSTAAEIERFIDLHEIDLTQIIRLTGPNSAANCHGWVFTGGRYGIRDPEIERILTDNGYAEISSPREGDLAIYRNGNKITHSGIVRIADRSTPILVESKWGPFGVYLHDMNKQPFAGQCKFYRSSRSGHALALRSSGDGSDADLDGETAAATTLQP